ncbi:MAG: hypothetical protein LC794_04815 [Acidobacteria bacterium]|nr:hypothetical protein [Acidobacteriota bacterium]
MPKKDSDKKPQKYKPSDLAGPLDWINSRSYGELKRWLREAIQHRLFLPVVIPHNVMPAAHLTRLLIKSEPHTKTYLRTIIPELIKEWGRNDSPQSLDDLLILCGNLNCNEAETAISRIVTEKLAHTPVDIELRLRALNVLQEIGTDRSLHVFKRYLREFDYAAVCYRSLYLLNLNFAVTELQDLMTLYGFHNATEELEDVLKILFKYTLTPAEHICVLQPLVELTPPETFIDVLETLKALDIINEMFMVQLPPISRVELIKQILKRGREEDSGRITDLLNALGATLTPPDDLWPVAPEAPEDETTETLTQAPARAGRKAAFKLSFGDAGSVPLITASELGVDKSWAYSRNYMPDIMTMLEGPPN